MVVSPLPFYHPSWRLKFLGQLTDLLTPPRAADQWSRPAPKITKPKPNVIIRLCSIECNFAVPLTDPSNAKFQADMANWALASNRTFIWNYITNFHEFVAPFPDWYSIGPNVRFFQEHGVTGLFQEGAYESPGSDLMELKDYLASAMMWDPSRDDRQVISTFLTAYYGKAAPLVRLYMDTMHGSIADTSFFMGEGFALDAKVSDLPSCAKRQHQPCGCVCFPV